MALLTLPVAQPAAPRGARRGQPLPEAPDIPDSDSFISQMAPRRAVRVAAAFVQSANGAHALRLTLCRHLGLQAEQVLVLGPADAAPPRFAKIAQRWMRLRPAAPPIAAPVVAWWPMAWSALAGAAAGLLVGQGAGVDSGAQCALLAVFAVAGLALGLLAQRPDAARAVLRPRRFDACLQRRLAAGKHAVVVQGVHGPRAVEVVEALQSGGLYWCAEAPLQAP
jgi:hypothetical protein